MLNYIGFLYTTTETYEIVEILVYTNLNFFLQNYQNQGQLREGKKEVRNDDKKIKQIKIFLYQLYPIYKIKNEK